MPDRIDDLQKKVEIVLNKYLEYFEAIDKKICELQQRLVICYGGAGKRDSRTNNRLQRMEEQLKNINVQRKLKQIDFMANNNKSENNNENK